MARKRSLAYWLLNILATGSLLLGPLAGLELAAIFLSANQVGMAVPTKDLPHVRFFITAGGGLWCLALLSVVLGTATGIRFRSRWGAAVASSAVVAAAVLRFGLLPLLQK